jgi:hypothetical protein
VGLTLKNNEWIIVDGVLKGYMGDEKRLVIPNGVTEIATDFFNYYRNKHNVLKEIIIPEGVTCIGSYAFRNFILKKFKYQRVVNI